MLSNLPVEPTIPNANVNLALTLDSAQKQEYFMTKVTDSIGFVDIHNLPVSADETKTYFLNAEVNYAGEDYSSLNPKGNGLLKVTLKKGYTFVTSIVVTTVD